ncbi:hypothetical protein R4172_04920 [Rhodococcus kroppenstedtii]|uniref:hypothetical protein n=1 Tax=Rhodococcoides kroppenstedtii TaxID=293050 RepID=UPI00295397B8|nr:hypothetical protein [Rhodococcus kroppenstedtii]MDV7196902.1 hypothetical protein [Rhodococcus kroppenstedtii]
MTDEAIDPDGVYEDIPAVNAARALHRLLTKVRQSGAPTIAKGWEAALQANFGTPLFAIRHTDAVGLFRTVIERLDVVQGDEGGMLRSLIARWHDAVVFKSSWSDRTVPAEHLIADDHLNQLASVAVIFDYQFEDRKKTVPAASVRALRESANEWLDLLSEESSLPEPLRDELQSQVRHLIWLLDHSRLFGSQPVIEKSNALIGRGFDVLASFGPKVNKRKWATILTTTIAALAFVNHGVDQTADFVENVNRLTAAVEEFQDGPASSPLKELEAKPPKALPPVQVPPVNESEAPGSP